MEKLWEVSRTLQALEETLEEWLKDHEGERESLDVEDAATYIFDARQSLKYVLEENSEGL